jgi:hypothetical protein
MKLLSMSRMALIVVLCVAGAGTAGPITPTFRFKDGSERQAPIIAVNRVLYAQRSFGFTDKIDLASVSKIDFE